MKNGITELVFILDKSGSMSSLEKDTIGGFNSMIEKQKKEEGEALITTVLFNHETDVLYRRKDLRDVPQMSEKDYYTEGSTALLDALGKTIWEVKRSHMDSPRALVPNKTMFVITTDGMENSSKYYTYSKIRSMIDEQKTRFDWQFIFLGANIDAVKEAARYGIQKEYAADYHSDKKGTRINYEAINEAVCSLRKDEKINLDWKRNVEKDYKERKHE